MHRLITTTERLNELCDKLAKTEFVTVDTEFIREKTYYPKLCLIQVAGPEDEAAIDPLAEGIDLSALFELMSNPNVLKVFHAAKQDLEIFYRFMGKVPHPLYDTQIAGMVCGYGEQIGYEALVNGILNESLDKVSRYTDWEQRPLTQRQINYAIADVTHLRLIYEKLSGQIKEQNRASWIEEEMATMIDESNYNIDPDAVWQRLKYKNRSREYLNILRATAAWRERMAQQKDVPRSRLLKDDVILQIASLNPKGVEELAQVRGAFKHLSGSNAHSLIDALKEARNLPKDQFPTDVKKRRMLTADQEVMVDVLKLLLKLQCEQAHVASKLVANKEDLAALVLDRSNQKIPCNHGWRFDIFGKLAHAFLDGEVHLSASLEGCGIRFIDKDNNQVA